MDSGFHRQLLSILYATFRGHSVECSEFALADVAEVCADESEVRILLYLRRKCRESHVSVQEGVMGLPQAVNKRSSVGFMGIVLPEGGQTVFFHLVVDLEIGLKFIQESSDKSAQAFRQQLLCSAVTHHELEIDASQRIDGLVAAAAMVVAGVVVGGFVNAHCDCLA